MVWDELDHVLLSRIPKSFHSRQVPPACLPAAYPTVSVSQYRSSPWSLTSNEDIVQELSRTYQYLEDKYLNHSIYLTGDSSPLSCDALLFAHLVNLYSLELLPSLTSLALKHLKLKEYFQNICETFFRSDSKISLKVTVSLSVSLSVSDLFLSLSLSDLSLSLQQSNDVLYPLSWRTKSADSLFSNNRVTLKQKEIYLIYGETWQPPSPSHDDASTEFSLSGWIRDEPCITASYTFPTLRRFFSWSSKSSRLIVTKDGKSHIFVSSTGIVFSSIVVASFFFSLIKYSKR
jgi:hypothetical protein